MKKKICIVFIFVLLGLALWGQNSSSATYTAGNGQIIFQGYYTNPPFQATYKLPLTVTVPSGARITSVDVAYDIRTMNDALPSMVNSYVKCTSLNGTYETSLSTVPWGQQPPVTNHYVRNGLNIANNVTGGGEIDFELHAFTTTTSWQGDYSYVVNGTFTVTVHYSDEFDFLEFSSSPNGMGQIHLEWENNNTPGNVLLATNSSDSFVDPVNGSSYAAGDMLGSAEILYFGDAEEFNHTGLEGMTEYFYKVWACDPEYIYSSGLTDNIVTPGDTEFPVIATFDSEIPGDWTIGSGGGLWTVASSFTSYPTTVTPQSGSGMLTFGKDNYLSTNTLATAPIYFPGINYSLSFYMYFGNINGTRDVIEVYVSSTPDIADGTMLASLHARLYNEPTQSEAGWHQYTFDLADYEVGLGSINYIIFSGAVDPRTTKKICLDQVKIESLPDFPENEDTTIDGLVIQPNTNLYYNPNINENHSLITSLPNYENLGNKKVLALTGFDADIDIQVTAPAGNWYGKIYYSGRWHSANPEFIGEEDIDRSFTFEGVDFTAKDGEVIIFLNDGEDSTLPVELSSFSAIAQADQFVTLQWVTESESRLIRL